MSRKRRKNRKGDSKKNKGAASNQSAQTHVEEPVEEPEGNHPPERFADLMSDTRPLEQGPARAAAAAAASPAVAHSRGGRGGAPAEKSGAQRSGAFRWPDPQDLSRAASEGVSDTTLYALGRGEPEPEERIDLHGARRDAAGPLLAKRIESARARGLRCLLIVHGHGKHSQGGETVLKEALPGWLSKRPCADSVLAFAPAPRNLGGAGATMVLIRRR